VREALAWLAEQYDDEMKEALRQGFLDELTQDQRNRLSQLSDEPPRCSHQRF